MKEQIIEYLKNNGFETKEPDNYYNESCNIIFEENKMAIVDNATNELYSNTLNLHWTIGVLIYEGLI